ncbi:MAG: hypothetical protein ACK5NG_04310 [Chthoniobacterales bacterium]
MEAVWNFISDKPFFWGLGLGLIFCALIAFFMWKSAFSKGRDLKKEINRLKDEAHTLQSHLTTQLKINAEGNDSLQNKLEDLQKQNENLRMNINALQQKPGRNEIRQIQVLETAVSRMREQAPGFAQAWEQAVKQADAEHAAAESGLTKLVRKVTSSLTRPIGIEDASPDDSSSKS